MFGFLPYLCWVRVLKPAGSWKTQNSKTTRRRTHKTVLVLEEGNKNRL